MPWRGLDIGHSMIPTNESLGYPMAPQVTRSLTKNYYFKIQLCQVNELDYESYSETMTRRMSLV